MKTLTAQVSDETFAEIETLAATANVSRDEFVAQALQSIAERQRRKASRDAEIIAEHNAYAAEVDTSLSAVERSRRYAQLREVEW